MLGEGAEEMEQRLEAAFCYAVQGTGRGVRREKSLIVFLDIEIVNPCRPRLRFNRAL